MAIQRQPLSPRGLPDWRELFTIHSWASGLSWGKNWWWMSFAEACIALWMICMQNPGLNCVDDVLANSNFATEIHFLLWAWRHSTWAKPRFHLARGGGEGNALPCWQEKSFPPSDLCWGALSSHPASEPFQVHKLCERSGRNREMMWNPLGRSYSRDSSPDPCPERRLGAPLGLVW